ncbi:MAG: hypothetical protein ABIJ39_06175 [Chloroflexota bacterium]
MKMLLPKIKLWAYALVLIILIAVVLVVIPKPSTRDIARSHWLNAPECTPPCWNGITPGQSVEDSLYILNRDPWITDIEVVEYRSINIGEIHWNWVVSSASGGRIFFYLGETNQDSEIYAILPGYGCCMGLGDIIHLYGEPDYVLVQIVHHTDFPTPEDVISYYTLVWIDKGFLVDGYPKAETWINEDFQIASVVFFVPTLAGYLAYEGNAGANAVPWHGYDDGLNYIIP